MKKTVTFETILGFLCFLALMLAGTVWLLHFIPGDALENILKQIKNVAVIVLIGCALVFGFLWLYNVKMNKTLKIVLMVFFVLFAVLAILGVFGI